MHQAALLPIGFIKNDKRCDELLVYIRWAAIRPGKAGPRDNDRAEEPWRLRYGSYSGRSSCSVYTVLFSTTTRVTVNGILAPSCRGRFSRLGSKSGSNVV